MRQFHYRSNQLANTVKLIATLPQFKNCDNTRVRQFAHNMEYHNFTIGTTIAKYGECIDKIFLIVKGEVKVFSPKLKDADDDGSLIYKTLYQRIPRLSSALYGTGRMIGEQEMIQSED